MIDQQLALALVATPRTFRPLRVGTLSLRVPVRRRVFRRRFPNIPGYSIYYSIVYLKGINLAPH